MRGIVSRPFPAPKSPNVLSDGVCLIDLHDPAVFRIGDEKTSLSRKRNIGGIPEPFVRIAAVMRRERRHKTERPVEPLDPVIAVVGDKNVDAVARPQPGRAIELCVLPPRAADYAQQPRLIGRTRSVCFPPHPARTRCRGGRHRWPSPGPRSSAPGAARKRMRRREGRR